MHINIWNGACIGSLCDRLYYLQYFPSCCSGVRTQYYSGAFIEKNEEVDAHLKEIGYDLVVSMVHWSKVAIHMCMFTVYDSSVCHYM